MDDYLSIPTQQEEPKSGLGAHIVDFIQTLVVFAAIGTAIYLFVAQPHKVSGLSMYPNFNNGDYIITDKVSYKFGDPKRGDIVVFKNPKDESQDFIKRVLALPGEKIKVLNNHIYIDNKILTEPYLPKDLTTFPGAFLQEGQEVTVENGKYIVIGDNRPNSSDSREWGFITKGEIIGKVFLRYWPKDSLGLYPAAYTYPNF